MIQQIVASFAALTMLLPNVSQDADAPDPALKAKVEALTAEAKTAQQKGDKATVLAKLDEIVTLTQNPVSMHQLAHMYEASTEVPGGSDKARRWFMKSAEGGFGEAQKDLARALENEPSLSNDDYSDLVGALSDGAQKAYNAEGSAMLEKLATKYLAAKSCAVEAAKRLGYTSDTTREQLTRSETDWYLVRSGSGASSRGDNISIYGAEKDSAWPKARYSRLHIRSSGFTGINIGHISAGEGRSIETKEYTGAVDASLQGQRDAEMISKTCRP